MAKNEEREAETTAETKGKGEKPNGRRSNKSGNRGGRRGKGGRGNKPGGKPGNGNPGSSGNGGTPSPDNPVSLYTKWEEYVKDAAKLPFALPVGSEMTITFGDGINVRSGAPGVMAIYFSAAVGVSNDFTSPVNRSSIRFYTRMRAIQRASGKYDHQDVMMMMLALDSCIMFHALCRRVIGLLDDYTPVNTYYPAALISASGFIWSDLRQNIQDFRAWINQFGHALTQYAIPKNVNLFERHSLMCEGMYTDSYSKKAQTYMFVPTGFWQYDNTVETGSQLVYKSWIDITQMPATTQQHTVAQAMQFGQQLLDAISNDEDFAIISGDIYNLYEGQTYQFPYVDEGYKVLPAYHETFLSQIENATIMGPFAPDYTPVISQNPSVNAGAILYQPYVTLNFSSDLAIKTNLMNFHWDSPTPDQVIEATRLMAMVGSAETVKDDTLKKYPITMCGTEIIHGVSIAEIKKGSLGRTTLKNGNMLAISGLQSPATIQNYVHELHLMQKFDWAPNFHTWVYDTEASYYMGSTWDVDNWDAIPEEYLRNINIGVLFSLFDIDVKGRS